MGDGGGSNSGEPAVKVHGRADITIVSSELKITDNGQSNSNPAIQVENGGKLTVNNVTATEVYKGIVVKDKGSSVIVNRGTIGVRKNGGAVIEVSGGGDVTLNREVTVNGGGDNTGIEVGQGGGTVTLVGTNFRNVKTGIVFKGNKGTANVVGVAGGATIGVTGSGSVGIKMEGDGRANATVMNMAFMGNRTATGAEVTSGTLTVNTVTMTNVQTGMKVTGSGRANVMGVGATINLASGGIGIKMEGGIANVVNMTFKGSGTGAEVTSGTLMLNTVKMTNVQTGAKVTNGMLTVNGGED